MPSIKVDVRLLLIFIVPIDEAAKQLIFLFVKKNYIFKILNEFGLNDTPNPTYEFSSKAFPKHSFY